MYLRFPDFLNPNALSFRIFDINLSLTWYSLSYIFGIICAWYLIYSLTKKQSLWHEKSPLNTKDVEDLMTYLILGIILGGRMGYVLFYNPSFYISSPISIFYLWEGGMSFHGGLIGVIISTYLFSRKYEIQKYILLDCISITAPIGIFFGRLSNFINGELVGKTTNTSWGVIFPNIDNNFRHPSQLYEAILEGLVLFVIMNLLFFRKNYKTGFCSCMFLIFYGAFRVISEFFREPDAHIGYVFGQISMGMLLSILMIIIGMLIFIKNKKFSA